MVYSSLVTFRTRAGWELSLRTVPVRLSVCLFGVSRHMRVCVCVSFFGVETIHFCTCNLPYAAFP